MISEEWLIRVNEEFRKSGVDQKRRPWEAIRRYSEEFKVPVNLSSNHAKRLFEWFEANSKPGVHKIGSMYESVYFFDSAFWTISIPIVYGQVELDGLKSLVGMPDQIKNILMSDRKIAWDYAIFWADSVDYGLGIDDLRKSSGMNAFGLKLLMAGDQELRSAVAMLKQNRPDSRAILSCRMAVEIFLKAFIALKIGLTEKEAKDLNHNLQKSFDRFIEVSGYNHWERVKEKLAIFPQIHERYNEQDMSLSTLWEGFSIAQSLGVLIVREHTDRNTIEQIKPTQS